jgi:hypothetical protein
MYPVCGGAETNDERIVALERRIKELEMCCEKLKLYVEDLDKRKADRVSDRRQVVGGVHRVQVPEPPRFEGSEVTRQQR